MRILDISRPAGPEAWTWPGDHAFRHGRSFELAQGASCNVSWFSMSCHTGTHADAPLHFSAAGAPSETIPLAHCVGPCLVTSLSELASARGAERVLVRAAGDAPDPETLARVGPLLLFGTDGHSVDPLDSKTLAAHHALWRQGAVILEELCLDGVPDGRYELVALPLKLVGLDAAPVRAVLIER